jgi:hypothetical protein
MKTTFLFKDADTIAMVAQVLMVSCRLLELQGNHHQHHIHHDFEKNSLEFLKKVFTTMKRLIHNTHTYLMVFMVSMVVWVQNQ